MKNCTEMNLNTYKTVGKGIKSRPELIKLIIDNCMCDGDALETIAPNFIHEKLTTLNLNNNLFGHSGAVALANYLPNLKSLKYLYMHNNEINTIGMTKLAPAIGKLVSLESIDISYNQIGVDGVKFLLESIKSLCYISFLNFSSNCLRVEQDSELCQTISLNIQAMMSLQTIVVDMTSSPLVLKTLMLNTQPYCRIYRSNLSQRSLFTEGSKMNSS
jgi:Ran GTPase-activating protein (RanGAP) involved in mRNA processing and transport